MGNTVACCSSRQKEDLPKYLREEVYSQCVQLLDLENNASGAGLDEPVSTVTFFEGISAKEAADAIKVRLSSVLAKNPFLAGRVVKGTVPLDHPKPMQLIYPGEEGLKSVEDEIINDLVRLNPEGLEINASMPYDELTRNIVKSPISLKKLDLNSSDLVTRITLISCETSEKKAGCAMVFQMSHVIADGATYYQVLNMIASAGTPVALNVERKFDTVPKMLEAQGQDDYNYMLSPKFASAAVKGLATGRKAQLVCRFVDDARMATAKAEAKKEIDSVKFVSSNDVLVSTMAKLTGARLFGEAISFRGKVEGLDSTDTGNYESLIWLDEQVYDSPAKLRKMMMDGAPYKGRGLPLPGAWETLNCHFSVMTNWAGFAAPLVIGGCDAQLHLPLVPTDMIPFENACVFRPNKDKLAVMYFTKRFEDKDYFDACPLGDIVSKAIFGP